MIGITWKDCYATKVDSMDAEHKRLVALIDQYFRAIRESRVVQEIDGLLEQIVEYTKYHFSHEEKIMLENGYPGYSVQRQEHLRMLATVRGFQVLRGDEENPSEELLLAIRNFLRDWLLHHIVEVDQKYGPFFIEKGVS